MPDGTRFFSRSSKSTLLKELAASRQFLSRIVPTLSRALSGTQKPLKINGLRRKNGRVPRIFKKCATRVAQLLAAAETLAKTARETRLAQIASVANTNFPEMAQLSTLGTTFPIGHEVQDRRDKRNEILVGICLSTDRPQVCLKRLEFPAQVFLKALYLLSQQMI